MKYTKTFEAFTKSYGEKISTTNFKDIPVGKSILYMGSRYKVASNDGFVLTLNDQDGNTSTVNLNQFNRGGQINEAARVPSNILDFAKRKGSYATSLVKKAATWAEKSGTYISGGTAIGKNYDTIILDMKHQGSEIYINLNDETIELFGEEVTDPKSFKKVLDANNANESILNEGRSIEKIEKDRTGIINDMAETVTNWKASKSSGDKEAEAAFLLRLKDLTARKNNLEKELTSAVSGKDRFIELVISEKLNEASMSDIDLDAQDAKDFKSFVKQFKKDYPTLVAGDPKELEAWLKTVYDSAKENMDESRVNEGQFSWMTQDTRNQIGSERENTIAVTMFDDKGNKWLERKYDGYGEFGGKDYYELLAQMNGVENAGRKDGIDLAFGKTKVKGKLLFPALIENPNRFNPKSHDFTQEPENDPNQSWYQEEDDDDYNEGLVSEGKHGMAKKLLDGIINGSSSEAEGIKMSKELAQHYLYWITVSPYGKRNENLPLEMLVKASFNFGIERQLPTTLKKELETLKLTINESAGIKKTIHDHWFETYGENFITEYPAVAKILKVRPAVTRNELARIWDETYGENFEKNYPGIWNKLD